MSTFLTINHTALWSVSTVHISTDGQAWSSWPTTSSNDEYVEMTNCTDSEPSAHNSDKTE